SYSRNDRFTILCEQLSCANVKRFAMRKRDTTSSGMAGGFSGTLSCGARFGPQRREHLFARKRVDDVGLLQPAATGRYHSEAHQRQAMRGMRVGGDDDFHAALFGHPQMRIV